MTGFLSARQIRIFDYPRFAEPLRNRVRERAAELASAAGITIEHLAKNHIRKEDVVARVLVVRGDRPGLVHIISAMEACDTYKPWHDKHTHRTFLRPDTGKCLHYYFYFIDAELGLIYLRVPTWCPFRLQFYCNGHSWLARQLTAAGVGFTLADNAFLRIDDWERAQALADTLSPDHLHRILDHYAQQCCPVLDVFAQSYHWSFMQVEYATDLVFRTPAILKPLYEQLSRQAILTVKAEHVATFLGHKITAQLAQEIGSQFTTRIEGTCVKHRFSKSSIKIYDKFGLVLRIETTTNDVSAFKHYRKVEHRHGPATRALAPVRKTIYSLKDLREILLSCNRRYLEYLSSLDDFLGWHPGARPSHPTPSAQRPKPQGPQLFQPRRTDPARRPPASRLQYRWSPPRRPTAAPRPILSRHPIPTTRPSAPSRRHQTRPRHLPLLSHPRWPRRHRCRPPPHRTHHHSCSGLTQICSQHANTQVVSD